MHLQRISGHDAAVWTHLKPESQGKTGHGIYPDGMVELDGSRLARAEAAFALACYESLSAAGRGCG
jgi:hypothetical protein